MLVHESRRAPRLFQRVTFAWVLLTMLFPAAIEINTRRYLTTDAAAFDQVAARSLLHGANPYGASLSAGAARLLDIPARYWTYTVTGSHVSHFSYPAGSLLLDAFAMALGLHHAVVDWVDLTAWLVTVVLLFALLPSALRWLACLIGVTTALLGSFTSGGTDAMFLPFLMLAVWRWDRFGQGRDAGVARWIGPIALGLACSVKQTPWFCVPILATGIFLEARRAGRRGAGLVLRYLATVLGVFAVVNVAFIIWGPAAWLHGTVTPLVGGLVADGQGLVSLATHGVTGGVNLTMLSVAAVMALAAVIAAFVVWYPHLKRIWLVLVPIPLFFSPRSLSSYLVDLFPAAMLAAITVRGARQPVPEPTVQPHSAAAHRRRQWSILVVVAPCIGIIFACVMAFGGAPLQMSVRGVTTSQDGFLLDEVTVWVHNTTAQTVEPHFMVNAGSNPNGFWPTSTGRHVVVLGPHASATVRLEATAPTGAPQPGAHWLVEAYTVGPTWLSTSPLEPYPLRH